MSIDNTPIPPHPWSAFEWQRECDYISKVTTDCTLTARMERHPSMRSFNFDKACLVRYCEMQRDAASRDGQFDAATFIQSCIDDLA